MLLWITLLCAISYVTSAPSESPPTCGYESCTEAKQDFLNVHIVAHTHDDVGWLKTVDQYYYGSNNSIQLAGVQYILDSVIKELSANPKRRFIYVETAFFWKWWTNQDSVTQKEVHRLVDNGQLMFVGGAWSMNDEAASHYQSTIDQFTWGLGKLIDTFGNCAIPRVGWQIDPFGHAREFASLLAGMGYDGLFLGRIDYQDKMSRKEMLSMETLWRGDDDLGKSSDIFTGVLYNTYQPPPGFCFDILCSDAPIVDDIRSPLYNVEQRVTDFVEIAKDISLSYKTNNILVTMGEDFNYQLADMWFKNLDKLIDFVTKMKDVYSTKNLLITMGGDFTYQNADMWYKNMDKLIEYTNLKSSKEGLKINLFYSTPTCYLKAVKDADPVLPTKQDDFFPYASDPHSYWTGYFTSRPTTKYFEREGNSYLQMAKQLQVLSGLEGHNDAVIDELKTAMGIMQHHDAITGTEKEHVAHDYERLLDQAVEDSVSVPRAAISKLFQNNGQQNDTPSLDFRRCHLNESRCVVSESSDQFIVAVYNPLAWRVNEAIRIPVLNDNYDVYAPNGDKIVSQLVEIPPEVLNIPTRQSTATHELVFIAYLKPLMLKTFYVKKTQGKAKRDVNSKNNDDVQEKVENKIKNDIWKANIETYDSLIQDELKTNNNKDIIIDYAKDDNKEQVNNKNKINKSVQFIDYSGKSYDTMPIEGNIEKFTADWEDLGVIIEEKDVVIENVLDLESLIKKSKQDPKGVPFNNEESRTPDPRVMEKLNYATDARKDYEGVDFSNTQKPTDMEHINFMKSGRKLEEMQRKIEYPKMDDKELRMLADDPNVVEIPNDNMIGNEFIKLNINFTTGKITHATLADGTNVKLDIKFYFYPGTKGDNSKPQNRASGAYIFRPNISEPYDVEANIIPGAKGPVVKEIRIVSETASAIIRIYDGLKFIENEWIVGPIEVKDETGKEYIVRYATDLVNNKQFYTDSNGRQMLKRTLNERPQWNLTVDEPVSANYYPVTNKIFIEDDKKRVVVLTDRSEGGTSLHEGQIELMLHRRLLNDDAFGVGEALDETANGKGLVARGRHRILLTRLGSTEDKIEEKKQVLQLHLQPRVLLASAKDVSLEKWMAYKKKCESFANELPEGLHLLTLEPWKDSKFLLRLENLLEKSDKDDTSLEVDLNKIFKNITMKSFEETNLAGHVLKKNADKRWIWKTKEEFVEADDKVETVKNAADDGTKVVLKAKEIRTFVVTAK